MIGPTEVSKYPEPVANALIGLILSVIAILLFAFVLEATFSVRMYLLINLSRAFDFAPALMYSYTVKPNWIPVSTCPNTLANAINLIGLSVEIRGSAYPLDSALITSLNDCGCLSIIKPLAIAFID